MSKIVTLYVSAAKHRCSYFLCTNRIIVPNICFATLLRSTNLHHFSYPIK